VFKKFDRIDNLRSSQSSSKGFVQRRMAGRDREEIRIAGYKVMSRHGRRQVKIRLILPRPRVMEDTGHRPNQRPMKV